VNQNGVSNNVDATVPPMIESTPRYVADRGLFGVQSLKKKIGIPDLGDD
jgi:hypothetical protein